MEGKAQLEQATPSANRQARRETAIPPANRAQVGKGTLSEPGRGGTRALQPKSSLDAAPAACADGISVEPERAGSYCSQPSFIPQSREPGAGRVSSQPIGVE